MRWIVLAFMVGLAGCDSGGGSCTGTGCTIDAGFHRDALFACAPSGTCTSGPACGISCCAAGEQCVNGTCMCGSGPACTSGDMCAATGAMGGDCGMVCCGATGPCPL